jgi:hypothetical protein
MPLFRSSGGVCPIYTNKEQNPMKNIPESERTKKRIAARAKSCYYNAFRVVTSLPEYADAAYVEGLAVLPCGIPLDTAG